MWVAFYCWSLLAFLLDGTLALAYHGKPTRTGWTGNDVEVQHWTNSSNSNATAPRPVIGWADSDVEVFQPAPDSNHMGEIVGGKDADYKKHPYQLQLALNGNHMCGAAIIGRWWAVTAGHCLVEKGRVESEAATTVRAGATYRNTGGRVHSVSKIVIHPRYDEEETDYDIALIKVRQPFQFGSQVQKIALPSQGQKIAEGQMAVASGWGYLKDEEYDLSDTLQYVKIPTVSQKKCQYSYRKYYIITDRMLCAGMPSGRKDTCQGDSGGPLALNGKLIGVVSWGIGCAVRGFPGVYARVPKFRYWIKEVTGI